MNLGEWLKLNHDFWYANALNKWINWYEWNGIKYNFTIEYIKQNGLV